MKPSEVIYIFYFLSLVFAVITSMYQYKRLDRASRILAILVCCALVNECVAYFAAKKFHNNMPVYSVYCFFEYALLCLYFNNVIDIFKKRHIGIYIGVAGIVLGILNSIFIQNIYSFNSYFLFLEGLSVIALSLLTFFRLLIRDDTPNLYKCYHFWFISILVFFWSVTFLTWGLYDYISSQLENESWKINFVLMAVGTITYGSLGCVFLLYNKMQSINE
jgi:hypothetical protein